MLQRAPSMGTNRDLRPYVLDLEKELVGHAGRGSEECAW